MSKDIKVIITDMKKRFKAQKSEFRGQISLTVNPDQIVEVCTVLRDTHKFEMLADLTATDYWPEEQPRFHLIYQFNSYSNMMRLEVRVQLDGNAPSVDSITKVYPNANWHERELFDMFGIRFNNHPDLRRLLMPHEWEGHPLRKDYPLGYEEVQFTFNYEEIAARKPSPKE